MFAHPHIPLPLCELLHIPALENAVKETLDTAVELVKVETIQVCYDFVVVSRSDQLRGVPCTTLYTALVCSHDISCFTIHHKEYNNVTESV